MSDRKEALWADAEAINCVDCTPHPNPENYEPDDHIYHTSRCNDCKYEFICKAIHEAKEAAQKAIEAAKSARGSAILWSGRP